MIDESREKKCSNAICDCDGSCFGSSPLEDRVARVKKIQGYLAEGGYSSPLIDLVVELSSNPPQAGE